MKMIKFLKQLFCKHNFIDKCGVRTYNGKSYQEQCLSYTRNKSCRWHNEAYELLSGYCDYYYQECSKCGKTKNKREIT